MTSPACPPMPWAEAREMLDRMLGRSEKTYPLMLLQLGAQARAVLAALARIDELEAAFQEIVDTDSVLCTDRCTTSHRMVEIASRALRPKPPEVT